jgi:hypothetical protein
MDVEMTRGSTHAAATAGRPAAFQIAFAVVKA